MAGPYYQGASGNDAADGLSWANRFLTFQKLLDTVAAGETGYTSGDTVTAQVDNDRNGGALGVGNAYTRFNIRGCDSSGNALTGTNYATITTSTDSVSRLMYMSSVAFYVWSNICWDGGGSGKATIGIETPGNDTVDFMIFKNCRVTNCSTHGLSLRTTTNFTFLNCEIDNNGKAGAAGCGVFCPTASRLTLIACGSKFHHNYEDGVQFGQSYSMLLNCLIYRNTRFGLYQVNTGLSTCIIKGCVFSYNGSHGVVTYLYNGVETFENNVMNHNGGYGVFVGGERIGYYDGSMGYNCSHANSSGHIDCNGGVLPGVGNVLADPKFVSETSNSEDFTLQSDSPCINAGLNPTGY